MVNLVFLDTETTGRYPQRHGVLEIGMVVTDETGESLLRSHEILVLPEHKEIDEYAMRVNQINLDEHTKLAVSRKEAAEQCTQILRGLESQSILIGHKLSFDLGFLQDLLGYRIWNDLKLYRQIDTLDIARFLKHCGVLKSGVGLQELARHYGALLSDEQQEHRALSDARLVQEVFLSLRQAICAPAAPASFPFPGSAA